MLSNKLAVVAAVVARDDVAARASVRLAGTVEEGKVVTSTMTVSADMPYEVKILTGLAALIEEMAAAGVSGAVFTAGSVLPRYFQARKLISRHNAADIMILPWMKERKEQYRAAFTALLAAMRRAKNRGITVIVHDTKELYRVRLEGAAGLSGTTVDIRAGISEEYGIRVINNDRFFGKVRVREVVERGGEIVTYGEIIADSLPAAAGSFLDHGRTAVKSAMSLLPSYTPAVADETTMLTVNGNF